MRPLITTHFVSLDGVAEAPGGEPGFRHTGWTFDVDPDPAQYDPKGREQEEATAFVMGRRSYDAFSEVWPQMEDFARYNEMPKYVVSTTLSDPSWHNTSVLRSLDDVAALKQTEGGPIIVQGSMLLTQNLLKAGLVDEVRLMVFPVVLGSGRGPFPSDADAKVRLTLADSTTYSNGVQYLVYRVQR